MRGFGEFVQFQLEYGAGAGAQIGELVLEFGDATAQPEYLETESVFRPAADVPHQGACHV
jgi:hypothetical protein